MKKTLWLMLLLLTAAVAAAESGKAFYWRGALYQDWMGFIGGSEELYSRLSTRLNLSFWNKPGNGWTAFLDLRNQFATGEGSENRLLVYEAHLAFDSLRSRFFFSLGLMNLYDTAGSGQLAGVLAGCRFGRFVSAGAYGGLENDVYTRKLSLGYQKYGVFFRYTGSGARQFSISYNQIRFENQNERRFVFGSLLLPLGRFLVVYGNSEYELDGRTAASDRLSRLFINARANLTRHADLTASYSSGRGMDYHQFLLEQSQNPGTSSGEIERFYYSKTYGVRFSFTPFRGLRFHVSRQESEQHDEGIKNHTTGFGFAAGNVFYSGISLYANYNMNRGDRSEADTYYISAARSFGRFSLNLSFANFFNGVRFGSDGTPQIVRIELPKQQTYSADLFLGLNRAVAIALNYAFLYQSGFSDQQFFVRLIIRK